MSARTTQKGQKKSKQKSIYVYTIKIRKLLGVVEDKGAVAHADVLSEEDTTHKILALQKSGGRNAVNQGFRVVSLSGPNFV